MKVREKMESECPHEQDLHALANAVVGGDSDVEHIITFLDESCSDLHKSFARDLRKIFEGVLRERLDAIAADHGGKPPVKLFKALLDMYNVQGCKEQLRGVLTLNYDNFVEVAAEEMGLAVNPGVALSGQPASEGPPLSLLKLHGSFGWQHRWPVSLGAEGAPLWIPPGIQKAKDSYPFNLLWGMARELLDCDVLRIVGCRLGPNDWDLVSLLFTTRHTRSAGKPYRIEVIDSPSLAEELKSRFPYLEVLSIFELEPIGQQIISEFIGGEPRSYASLTAEERRQAEQAPQRNWFQLWLTQTAEAMSIELGSVATASGAFEALLEV